MQEKVDEITKQLTADGYTVVLPWSAAPGEIDFPHAHRTHSVQIVLSGEITFMVNEREAIVRADERHEVPARTAHEALTGADGCMYIFGLK